MNIANYQAFRFCRNSQQGKGYVRLPAFSSHLHLKPYLKKRKIVLLRPRRGTISIRLTCQPCYPLLSISDEYEASFQLYDWLVLFWALSWRFGHNSQFGQWLKMRSDVTIFLLNHRPEFLEAWLSLTRVNYHRKVYVSKLLN